MLDLSERHAADSRRKVHMITMSYGGGKQTVALVCLILKGKLPMPDIFVFADTGREVVTTFEYLAKHVQPALSEFGRKVEIVGHEYSSIDLFSSGGDMLLPAFTRQNNTIGKMPTFCSNEWKQRPIRRWLKERDITDTDVWLGISLDEAERMKSSGLKWYRHVYPLIELAPMNRQGCVNVIQSHGWPVPDKSRCWMCPNQSPQAWKDLKRNQPDDFDKAVKLEDEIRTKDEHMYFHSLAVPLKNAVDQSEMQSDMFDGCDSGYCFV